ncbi:SLAM family member 5 [Labeo rohita]|uniref:SLAM family member 5 n=1 Tax=Labeo rohita TaxID=84645 RepID=A0ABQ8L6V0_LABRO|nr:SLAM family member 5 [Labeo rohita]
MPHCQALVRHPGQKVRAALSCAAHTDRGVFADTDAVKSVSVMEGDSVTLNTGLTEMMDNDLILWRFGTENTLIAKINVTDDSVTLYNNVLDGRFRDRLKLDDQTGSLTITNILSKHSGDYKLLTNSVNKNFNFNVTVYVVNVSRVSLSWYKGNSLLSSISVSDLSISLSLPLEVEYQDKNTYSCVINNPISNQTNIWTSANSVNHVQVCESLDPQEIQKN